MKKATSGFTIVELLIVIVVIAILAAISIVAYTGVQSRARDSKRANDIAQIKKALLAYDIVHSGVVRPGVSGYTKPTGEPSFANWDVSTSTSWLVFLRSSMGSMPVDPLNITPVIAVTGAQPLHPENRHYMYFCYDTGNSNGFPDSAAVVLRYRNEDGLEFLNKFRVSSCLLSIPS